MKKERNATPEKFKFEDGTALYCIKHVPTGSVYIGVTTNIKMRMRNHISKLRKGTHPCYPLQCLFEEFPNVDEWEPTILSDEREHAKAELLELETNLIVRATRELPDMIILNSYKNEDSHQEVLIRLEGKIRVLGLPVRNLLS